ncbi:MAG TPA: NUDIX hydrolase N-terminal domain-containing protein [Polyangiaceae bacterium]|nr:NUDIX hydrolase N-terminal domain-containing protein [Polyangiaceae bacterium]
MSFDWLVAAQRLRAMAQTGLTYSKDRFDLERYRELTAIAQAMLSELLLSPPAAVAEAFAVEKGYPTPKLDVRTAVFREGRVLLVQEWLDGAWTLPGGWADEGDSPREAAERECREESGYEVRVTRLIALRDRSRHDYRPRHLGGIWKVLFLAELTGGEAQVSEETTDVGFFALDALPALSLARTLPGDLELARRYALDPTLLATFD